MLRNPNLAPLSRQHQHALALCVRIDRAPTIPEAALAGWREEVTKHFASEIKYHFLAEETVLFPVARKFTELVSLVDELLADHEALREYFSRATAGELNQEGLRQFASRLSQHIRREERELFERLQQRMTSAELESTGRALDLVLAKALQACSLPQKQSRELKREQ